MIGKFVGAALLVAVSLLWGPRTHATGPAPGDSVGTYDIGRIEAPMTLARDGSLTYGPVRALSFSTDATGRRSGPYVVEPVSSAVLAPGPSAPSNGRGCIYSSKPAGLVVYRQLFVSENDAREYVYYVFSPYRYRHARTLGGVAQDQFEMCVKGGSSTYGGWKQDKTGGSAFLRSLSLRMIGWSWASGTSLSTVSATLGFQVGSKRATSISGSITVNPTDRNTGAQGRIDWDPGNPANSYPYNADHGWWQTGCSGWRWCGVTNYEGTVLHGLWEFPSRRYRPASFSGTAEWMMHCSRPFGWGCS
jgi:hypothetical protein